ncbi:glycerol-3-phosphate dehydrogenase/oxidase [Agrobacterium sp. a22-2]|uniref:glycerol-3-phosphate dehydrogenase/oxidase n=1 Tax=Agrobacterium sp. a22-2 TaxID=2283840 RepID=UPI001447C846|nr:glycerol-3-phosphate dehydrogenase/oxidase [Agrobacterium sp. a22-2]NKN38157.1 glycerol-3-phosphate dehydrogenase/oxidase [Agrobacterium sp. a22-2]
MRIREQSLARIASGASFDVLIIGGGVNGVAVLRELALNGVSALLVERSDFCMGASGASSRMAHGGLRYLENREFKLVAESTCERNLLLKYAPHFTRPLEVVVPLTSYIKGLPGSILRFMGVSTRDNTLSAAGLKGALYLYEFLGRVEKVLPLHRMLLSRGVFPERLAARYKAVISYFDARIRNPEALVLEMIEDALSASQDVACLNHAEWSMSENGDITVLDSLGGQEFALRPKVIVNASGAWVDRVNQKFGLQTHYIRPVKGAHLLIRHDELFQRMAGRAFYFDDGKGRMVICYPLDRTILLGTTEIQVEDPNDASIAPAEVDYLLSALSSLFDDIKITADHIATVTTGIRPLQSGGGASANQANRDHMIAEDRLIVGSVPLLSLVGGKWTTFRAFGEQAGDRIFGLLKVTRKADTRRRPYPGAAGFGVGEDGAERIALQIASTFGLSPKRAHDLVKRYGAIAADVAAHCAEENDRPVASLPDYSKREIGWLVVRRAALMLDDLLLRRTQIVLDGRCNEAVIREFATILAEARGLDSEWARAEVARCLEIPALIIRSTASLSQEAWHG